jgi:hypothetical protein
MKVKYQFISKPDKKTLALVKGKMRADMKKALEAEEDPGIARLLPEDWPFWFVPNCSDVKKEITADPRWEQWVEKCRA